MTPRHPTISLPFEGVDGEGATDPSGRHQYLYLRSGNHILETGKPLGAADTIPFLASLPAGVQRVSYFFDYDVTMICRDLPGERVRRLLDREGRTFIEGRQPLPVNIGEYQIDYLPRKEFRVRKEGGPWTIISDTGTFFQSRFTTTLDKWSVGDDNTRDLIKIGKDRRNDLPHVDDEMRQYNGLEIVALQELMDKFRQACEFIGYMPARWQGPGNLASAMLTKHKLPKTVDIVENIPWQVWEMAQSAYYGGRFETTASGPVKGPIWQWDINSAYPYACTKLPCLVHSRWRYKACRPKTRYWLADISFGHGPTRNKLLCHLPIRMADGSIRYPRQGRGWYWSVEVLAAERAGTTTYAANGYWECVETCKCDPFGWINTLYTMRVAMGKSNQGLALKLAMNSLYGKQAQSIGAAPFANPVYAGLITAITRSMLVDAYAQAPTECYMLATDAVFMGVPINLPTGGLGAWDCVRHDDGMFIIQPGLYFTSKTVEPKTRGVPMGKVLEREQEFREAFADDRADVEIPLRQFIGLRLASARNRLDTAGEWVEPGRNTPGCPPAQPKRVGFDWSTKRRPFAYIESERGLRTLPYPGEKGLVTTPYDKNIGGNSIRDRERLEKEDQPDWADALTHPGEIS